MWFNEARAWGPPEQRHSTGGRGGGWRMRLVAVAGRGAADCSVGSDSACAAAPGSLAGLRERVLFIGTQFSILYTSMYSPA